MDIFNTQKQKINLPNVSLPNVNLPSDLPNVSLPQTGLTPQKFLAETGVQFANLFAEGLDYTTDLVVRNIDQFISPPDLMTQVIKATPWGRKIRKQWTDYFDEIHKAGTQYGAPILPTQKLQQAAQKLSQIEYIQPSKEWTDTDIKGKLSKEHIGETLFELGPSIVASMGTFALSPTGGLAIIGAATANDVKDSALSYGVEPDKAELLGLSTGILVSALERIVPSKIFSGSLKIKNQFIGGLAKRLTESVLLEAGTEVTQEGVQMAAEATFRDIGLDEATSRVVLSALGGALGGGFMQMIGSFSNEVQRKEILGNASLGLSIREVGPEGITPELQPLAKEAEPLSLFKNTIKQTEPIFKEVKLSKDLPQRKMTIKSVGNVSDYIVQPKLREAIKDALDTPIYTYSGEATLHGYPEASYKGIFSPQAFFDENYDLVDAILINEKEAKNLVDFKTIFHEAIHAQRYKMDKDFDFSNAYDKRVFEQSAKRAEDFYNQAKGITPVAQKGVKEAVKSKSSKIIPTEQITAISKESPVVGQAVKRISKVYNQVIRTIEPATLVGKENLATITKGTYGKSEAKLIEFDQTQLTEIDKTTGELEEWYNKNFTPQDLENLMLSRGKTASQEAFNIQQKAINSLPKELTSPSQIKAIQEIADNNYNYLQQVAGGDITKVADYFYGLFKNTKATDKFLEYWQTTDRFQKFKSIPTVADAQARGLELKSVNPVTNLEAEFRSIAQLEGMQWMKNELLNSSEGVYIDTIKNAPVNWEKINDPVFAGLRAEPNTAKLINNLIETNKVSQIPALNALRNVNNFTRTLKFVGSLFHVFVVLKQSIADTGYAQFIQNPKTILRGFDLKGFSKNDPLFNSPEYKRYVKLGGGHRYSFDFQAQQAFTNTVNKINQGKYLGAATKLATLPVKIPLDLVQWMFNKYIPKIKFMKTLDTVNSLEIKKGRTLTDGEFQEVIKEGQNFYGMMNERIFGRSGTNTSLLRFVFMSPGFAEGNFRTILKAISQKGAGRSRYNMINSLLISGILATVGTLALTGKPPKEPEKIEDIRDLLKVDTGKVDSRGRKIMIDMLTYDKDYWNLFNVLRGKPDVAVTNAITRVGGMKASSLGLLTDLAKIAQGEALYDWKGNKVIEITDPLLTKLQKFVVYESDRFEPIALSVFNQWRDKDIDVLSSAVLSFAGVRATKTEQERRNQAIISRLFSLKDQQEQLYYYLGTIKNPREAIQKYNDTVNSVLDNPLTPKSIKGEWSDLIINTDRLLSNKIYQLTGPMTTMTDSEKAKEIAKLNKYLQNFGMSNIEARELLDYYFEQHPVKNPQNASHLQTVRERNERLIDSFSDLELPNIELPNVDLPNVDLPNFNL